MSDKKPVKMVLRSVHLPKDIDDMLTTMSRDTRTNRDVLIKYAVIDWLSMLMGNESGEDIAQRRIVSSDWSIQDNTILGL